MRRVVLVLLGIIVPVSICIAQTRNIVEQKGNLHSQGIAVQNFTGSGMTAASSNDLRIGNRVFVTNPANGKEIIVSIRGAVSPVAGVVIDLSADAAAALELPPNGHVLLNFVSRVAVVEPEPEPEPIILVEEPEPEPEPEPIILAADPGPAPRPEPIILAAPEPEPMQPEPEPEPIRLAADPGPVPQPEPIILTAPEPVRLAAEPVQPVQMPRPRARPPINITIFNYIEEPESPPIEPRPDIRQPNNIAAELDYLVRMSLMTLESPRQEPVLPPQQHIPQLPPLPPQEPVHLPPQQSHLLQFAFPPAADIQVIPGLPDPNNGRVYRLQIGSFSSELGASYAFQLLLAAGFEPAYDYSDNTYRVLAVGIPASTVSYAVMRLGSIGFSQVWVREQ